MSVNFIIIICSIGLFAAGFIVGMSFGFFQGYESRKKTDAIMGDIKKGDFTSLRKYYGWDKKVENGK